MLRYLKLKKEIKTKAINKCLSLYTLLEKYKATWNKGLIMWKISSRDEIIITQPS